MMIYGIVGSLLILITTVLSNELKRNNAVLAALNIIGLVLSVQYLLKFPKHSVHSKVVDARFVTPAFRAWSSERAELNKALVDLKQKNIVLERKANDYDEIVGSVKALEVANRQRTLQLKEQHINEIRERDQEILTLKQAIKEVKGKFSNALKDKMAAEALSDTGYMLVGTKNYLESIGVAKVITIRKFFIKQGEDVLLASGFISAPYKKISISRQNPIIVTGRVLDILPTREARTFSVDFTDGNSRITVRDPAKFWCDNHIVVVLADDGTGP